MSTRKSEPGAGKREMNPIKRHYAKPTRKTAIFAMCSYCMGCTATEQENGQEDHLEPCFRTYIGNCTAPSCPLYGFRPYQRDEAGK
jgi:hypothetical protein